MTAYWNAVLLVVVGEMGDKTQLLAMAMAGKYKAGAVMLGVLVATVLNHALAVLVGSYLSSVLPLTLISIVAGVSFLIFGLWTLRGDEIGDEHKKASRFGPIVTVAIAFFLAEMGDKTQLMTITLAAEYRDPLWILMGTTTGMLIADGLGVLCGAWLCKHISQTAMKWMAGLVFLFFGSLTIYNNLPAGLANPLYILPYLLLMSGLIYLVGIRLARRTPTPCEAAGIEMEEETPEQSGVLSLPGTRR